MAQTKSETTGRKGGFGRWVFRIAGILLLLIIATMTTLYLTGAIHSFLRQTIITELSRLTKSEVTLEGLQGDLITYIDIHNLVIGNQCPLAEGEAMRLRYARVYWSPWALLNGRIKVDRIYAEDAYLYVTQNPGHADLNVAEMFATPPGPAPMTDIEIIRLRGGRVDLNLPDVPFKQLDITDARAEVHSSGRITRVTMDSLQASLPQLNLPIENFTGSVEYHEKVRPDYTPHTSWTLFDKFDLKTPRSHLRMHARVDNIPELKGEYVADGSIISLNEFAPLLKDAPKMTGMLQLNQNKITVAGNDVKIQGEITLLKGSVDQYDIESLHASGELHNKDLTVDKMTGRFSDGIISNAFGHVTLEKVPEYDLFVGFESLNLSKIVPEAPETVISGEVTLTGQGVEPADRALVFNAELLPSTIAGVNLDYLSLRSTVAGETLNVDELNAGRGEGMVQATGIFSPQNVDFRLDAQNIALADMSFFTGEPNIAGKISLQGGLGGSFNNIKLYGNLTGTDLNYQNYFIKNLLANLEMDITPEIRGRGSFKFTNGNFVKVPIDSFSADVELLPNLIEVQNAHAVGPDAELQTDLAYEFGRRQKVTVRDLALQYRALRLLCPQGFTVTQQPEGWDISRADFDLVGLWRKTATKSKIAGLDVEAGSKSIYDLGKLSLEGRLSVNSPSDLIATLTGFPFQGIDSLMTQNMNLAGKVDNLTLHYIGTIPEPSFELDANISNGPLAELPGSGNIKLTYNQSILQLDDLNYQAAGGRLTGKGCVCLVSESSSPFQPEPLSIRMENIDLRIFQEFTDVILIQNGNITGGLTVNGDVSHPTLEGKIHLADGRFLLGELYNYVSDFSGDIYFEKDRIVFGRNSTQIANNAQDVLPMSGLLDGKPARLEGEIALSNLTPKNFDLYLYAGGINFRSLPGSQFKLSADVGLRGNTEQLKLYGKVKVLSGLMNIPFGSSDAEQEPELSTGVELPFDMDIALGADRGIWLRNSDADFELAANIRVEYSRGLLSLSGDLDTVRGVYHFIGRDFTIEQGKLTFLGTPTFDPALNIEGVTTVVDESTTNGRMSIYIKVTGTITHPEITLNSPDHPNLVQNDLIQILAFNMSYQDYLVLNINPLGQQGEQYLTSYLSGRISGAIRPYVALDTLSFEWTSFDQTPDQVTVGKYLTSNLYLSYTQPLLDSPSTMRKVDLEYFLGGGFSLVGMANERARERAAGLSLRYVYRY